MNKNELLLEKIRETERDISTTQNMLLNQQHTLNQLNATLNANNPFRCCNESCSNLASWSFNGSIYYLCKKCALLHFETVAFNHAFDKIIRKDLTCHKCCDTLMKRWDKYDDFHEPYEYMYLYNDDLYCFNCIKKVISQTDKFENYFISLDDKKNGGVAKLD